MDTSDAGRLGGFARAKKLSKKKRKAIASAGGQARAVKLSPSKRRRIAQNAAAARWPKRKEG